jgi:hypothetical protein
MVCCLLSMFLKRITFEEHISYWLEALHLRFSVLGLAWFYHNQRVDNSWAYQCNNLGFIHC